VNRPGPEYAALMDKESEDTIGMVEHWNNGMMGLRTEDILIWFACAVFYSMRLNPLFQHSNIPRCFFPAKPLTLDLVEGTGFSVFE